MQQAMACCNAEEVALIAPTGSGKTLAFALPLLAAKGRGVVIAPTRELVLQIAKTLGALAPKMRIVALYGGHSVLDETRSLQAALPDIIVGTPGRLLDHINRGRIDRTDIGILVADEYDKSLELGFQEEMRRIVRYIRRPKRLILTSATQLNELPEWLAIKQLTTLDYSETSKEKPQLKKFTVQSPEADKLQTLKELLLRLPHERTIVFVNHRESAERVNTFLRKEGFPTVLYHGALEQLDRETAVDLFVNGTSLIMVATDLAARGLDIPQVASVIHYHSPVSNETLTHRNGRSGRMGAEGNIYYILAPNEKSPDEDTIPMQQGLPAEMWQRNTATLFFHAGRREKLSKGDIVGALTGPGNLRADQIGIIALHDHRALAAIPSAELHRLIETLNSSKIKGKRIRVTPVKA